MQTSNRHSDSFNYFIAEGLAFELARLESLLAEAEAKITAGELTFTEAKSRIAGRLRASAALVKAW